MFTIKVDPYRKQTNADFFRVLKLMELQNEWNQEDINAAYDRIYELEKEKTEQVKLICKLERERARNKGGRDATE